MGKVKWSMISIGFCSSTCLLSGLHTLQFADCVWKAENFSQQVQFEKHVKVGNADAMSKDWPLNHNNSSHYLESQTVHCDQTRPTFWFHHACIVFYRQTQGHLESKPTPYFVSLPKLTDKSSHDILENCLIKHRVLTKILQTPSAK